MATPPEQIRSIVALGGGTGMTALLSGLHSRGCEVCAVVTVADDGGSSGRLRKAFDIPPPGDIRNCLVSLSDADPLIGDLFQYRFDESVLKGHSFGNLFIAVLTKITGDFRLAIEKARSLLSVRGMVVPSTERKVVLVAEHEDGSKSTGEQAISRSGKPISGLRLAPRPPHVSEEIRALLSRADLICLGPGSLYTSILPNLLIPGMVEAINDSPARVVYVSNLMTQPGETDGMMLAEHTRAIAELTDGIVIDHVLHPSDELPEAARLRYAAQESFPVKLSDRDAPAFAGMDLVDAPLISSGTDQIRHDPELLADALIGIADRPADEAP